MANPGKYRERDRSILKLLLSENWEHRNEGLVQVHVQLRSPVLQTILNRVGAGYLLQRFFSSHEGFITEQDLQFDDAWQAALKSVWQALGRGSLSPESNLHAYVTCITIRRIHDLLNSRRREDPSEFSEFAEQSIGFDGSHAEEELLLDIESFVHLLDDENRELLWLGLELSRANGTRYGLANDLVKDYQELCRDKGWELRGKEAIMRQYRRLKEKLEDYLSSEVRND